MGWGPYTDLWQRHSAQHHGLNVPRAMATHLTTRWALRPHGAPDSAQWVQLKTLKCLQTHVAPIGDQWLDLWASHGLPTGPTWRAMGPQWCSGTS